MKAEGRTMTQEYGREFWEQHWQRAMTEGGSGSMAANPPNPYLARETSELAPGKALDAGCGAGAEAIWLASRGWQVTAVDIASEALALAAQRATASGVSESVRWVEADLSQWQPDIQFDLVTTHYAHPAMPQLEFYDRISGWVTPGGTLLIVGHLHTHDPGDRSADVSVTSAAVATRLDHTRWEIVTAEEARRTLAGPEATEAPLHDVVVRATRRPR
jgi:cyclopropane fatty-acyl-phospholipid synthase-like methyltransferase